MLLEEISFLDHCLDIPVLSVGHPLSAEIWARLRVPDRHCISAAEKVMAS